MRRTLTRLGNYYCDQGRISPLPHLAACPNRPVCPACRDGRCEIQGGVAGSGLPLRISTGKPGYQGEIPQVCQPPSVFKPPRVDAALLGGIGSAITIWMSSSCWRRGGVWPR